MAYEGVQTRHRSLEEQVQQLRENHQQTTEELRQALAAQNQALTEAITNAITDLLGSNTHVPYIAICPPLMEPTPWTGCSKLRSISIFGISQKNRE
nr:hypothetical protein Iba_chr06cCG5910 [Ipomoea batatas]